MWIDDDFVICPAWVPFDVPSGVTVIRIEPGATFGFGDHPTTILSMRAVRAVLRDESTVLDVGCGSGVLAVGACVLGASSARGDRHRPSIGRGHSSQRRVESESVIESTSRRLLSLRSRASSTSSWPTSSHRR